MGDPRESIEELALDFSLGERLVQGGDLDLQLSNFLVQIGGLVGTIVKLEGLLQPTQEPLQTIEPVQLLPGGVGVLFEGGQVDKPKRSR